MSDLERIPAHLRDRSPARTVRASPAVRRAPVAPTRHGYRQPAPSAHPHGLDAHVRVVPRAAAPAPRGLAAWRREHYVADQAIRVGIVLAVVGAALLAVAIAAVLAFRWAFGGTSGVSAGSALGIIGAVLVAAGLIAGRRGRGGGSGHAGHGWHYSKCRR